MGNVIFWLLFVGFIILIVVSGVRREKSLERKQEKGLIDDFGTSDYVDNRPNNRSYKELHSYICENKKDNMFFIDDITWNDLSLATVFDRMNGTLSSSGEEYLYSRIRTIYLDEESKKFRNDSVKFILDPELRLKVQKSLSKLGKMKSISSFKIFKNLFDAEVGKVYKDILVDLLIILSFVSIFVSPGIGFIFFIIMLIYSIGSYFKSKALMDENIRAFSYLLRLINCAKMINRAEPALVCLSTEIGELNRGTLFISKRDGTSSNPISLILDYIRMIFHIDIIVYSIRMNQIKSYRQQLIDMYIAIGYIDAVIAVASYSISVGKVCEPEFIMDNKYFDVEDIYHPLSVSPVLNDICEENGVLITGSNASGKSTFLKMVGVNILFSQTFGFAFASKIRLSHFKLYTSMALTDNLLANESYYVVETKSLKRIFDGADEGNVFAIVDEVLKGTNTSERIAASCEILKALCNKNVICYVATHDMELTELLAGYYSLYSFAEEIRDKTVIFPYKITKGSAKTRNAIRILDTVGFDKDIINKAYLLVEKHDKEGKWVD